MNILRLVLGPLETNCWLVSDGTGGPVIVIDPADEPQVILEALRGRPVSVVALTHGHFDHLAAASEVMAAAGGVLQVHAADAPWITSVSGTGAAQFGFDVTAPPAGRELHDDDTIEAGGVSLEVLHTPGHTPGCICLLGEGHLFSGDTLFAGSVGRTDFPRGDGAALRRSIAQRLAPLADDVLVHPGHGAETTIGRERRVNPFFPRA